jgi:hypothetical protein
MDTDKGLDMVLKSCAESSTCALHEKTPDLVRKRLDSIFALLKVNPLPVINGSNYGVADWALARSALFQSLYKPAARFPLLAQALADVEKGDGAGLYAFAASADSLWRCECGFSIHIPDNMHETGTAVACGEGTPVEHDLKGLKAHYAKMAQLSSFADVWPIHAVCR